MSKVSETLVMTSEGLGEMFKSEFAHNMRGRWGAEQRVKRAQTSERGPPSAPAELCILINLLIKQLINQSLMILG